jgi:5,10-methylenetetrahydromethanopterin reductase
LGEKSGFKVGLRIPSAGPMRSVVEVARRAEAVGLDMAWFSDSPLNYREVWTVLGAVSMATERICIGPAVTNLASRHLTVTASAARTVAEAAPGRFVLGLGVGDSGVGYDNLRPSTVAGLEQGVKDLRSLLSGGAVRYESFDAHLRDAGPSAPPILVAASGPKTLRMAGGVGDGVIMPMGNIAGKIATIREGADAAGRPMPQVYVLTIGGLIENRAESLLRMKVFCARVAQDRGTAMFEQAGFKIDGEFLNHKMGAEGDIGHAASVIDLGRSFNDVISDECAAWYTQEFTLLGSEDEMTERMGKLQPLGVTGAYVASQENSKLPDELVEVLGGVAAKLR